MQLKSRILLSVLCFGAVLKFSGASTTSSTTEKSVLQLNNSSNLNDTDGEPKDLYVIKTIVYEVGILTDVANDTDTANETHEKVDVSFYDPEHNGTTIDLSNIPLPIQTNVSGISVTGLLPAADLGSLLNPKENDSQGNNSPPLLPKKQIKVTQNISTSNPERGSEIISNLPKILGLDRKVIKTNTEDSSEKKKNS